MARGRKKNTKTTPIKILLWILAFIGKPIYFVLSKIVIFFIFLISVVIASIPKIKLEILQINLFEIRIIKKLLKKRKFRIKKRYVLLTVLVFSFLSFYFLILKDLPSPNSLRDRNLEVSTKIYDRNGILLYKIYKDKNRSIVPFSKIPQNLKNATLAIEDAEFYMHSGFSVKGISRSILQNLTTGSLSGGSTITQQLIKNTLLSPEKTFVRKIKELILAVQVENQFTKDQILEMYLNEVNYGGTAYGIAEASLTYFGKEVDSLNLAESALLAGIPKSPTLFSPFGENPEKVLERQKDVLKLMRINKFITKEEEETALKTQIQLISPKTEILAPHFVMYIKKILVDQFGEDIVQKGGLEVVTSLDLNIQKIAEKVVSDEVLRLKSLKVGNGSALVLNPKNNEILAMVGSKNYFDTKSDGNVNVLTRLRQPGSSIKIINYSYALSNGYYPSSIIDDSPITYSQPGQPAYTPKNYDGKYVGKISLRDAFAQSRNIPAIKILASYGVSEMISLGRKMGVNSWVNPNKYGLSLTLGGGSITGLELANVYSVIANGGIKNDLKPILLVKDYKGKLLYSPKRGEGEQILDKRVAYQIIDILKDNQARSPAFGLNSSLKVNKHPEIAVKTGTSNDLRDNWTVGFNQKFLVLTWVGNNDNTPMSKIASGITGASTIWNKIFSTILEPEPQIPWQVPPGLIKLECRGKIEYFLREKIDPNYCKIMEQPTNPSSAPNTINNKEEQKVPQVM